MLSDAMRWPLAAQNQLVASGETIFSAVLAGAVAYVGFQLQQGGRQARLRRRLVTQLELRKALGDVDSPRAAETRNRTDHEVERLLEAYAPTREEMYARDRHWGIAALVVSVFAGVGSAIFLPSQEWLVGGLFGLAASALTSLGTTANHRRAYLERRKKEHSEHPEAD